MSDVIAPLIELVPVDADDERLARLLQLYIHEWSELVPVEIGLDARFRYDKLPRYRDRESHMALLIVEPIAGRPLGFALAMRDDQQRWHVEEFFVIAGARGRRIGAIAAQALFARHPGPWTLTVREENPDALAFWRRVMLGAEERIEPGADGVTRTRLSLAV